MPFDIQCHPQLAVLAVLDTTLVTAARAVAAAHPELLRGPLSNLLKKTTHCADRVVYLSCELQRALAGYRLALIDEVVSQQRDRRDR